MVSPTKHICVVGAGGSGLPCIHFATLYGFSVTCLESSDGIGGLWRYKPEGTEESSVMKATVINTSKEMTAYSDFPPPKKMPTFMHNSVLHKYMENYAEAKGLYEHIRFRHKVRNISRADDYSKTGKWNVEYEDAQNNAVTVTFDAVLIASGHHANNNWPEKFLGQETFKGNIIHGHDYKTPAVYDNKTVIVVGVGNSGVDVACELARLTKQTYLVTRRGTWVFGKAGDYGSPSDMYLNNRFMNNVVAPLMSSDRFCDMVEGSLNKRFDHEKFGIKPKHRVLGAHPTLSDELPNRIMSGTVKIRPQIKEFRGNTVVFEDGTEAEEVDDVIYCTGYNFDFPLIEGGKLIPVKNNRHDGIYKNIFPYQTADKNTLGMIGLVQPWGSVMPVAELQSRVFFAQLRGDITLPNEEEMKKEISIERETLKQRYVQSDRHTLQIDFVPYCDSLSKMIGVHPEEWKLLFTDPQLFKAIYFGPCYSYIYRIRGPHKWNGAREAILGAQDRTEDAYTVHSSQPSDKKEGDSSIIFFLIAGFILFIAFLINYFFGF